MSCFVFFKHLSKTVNGSLLFSYPVLSSYAIFLCTFVPFARDEKVYRFSTMCENVQVLPLGDGRCIMFLNTNGSVGELGADMVLEFADFNQERPLNSTKVRVKQNNRTQPIDRLSVLRHFTIGSIGVLAKFT